MALMSYVQRRRSGVYEFGKRLPQILAGKDARAHVRDRFGDLIDSSTGKFKHEFVRSLDTREADAAKTQAHRIALKLAMVVEEAFTALTAQRPALQTAPIDTKEIREAVFRRLLTDDEDERLMGDDRRRTVLLEHSQELGREVAVYRAAKWPLLEALQPAYGSCHSSGRPIH